MAGEIGSLYVKIAMDNSGFNEGIQNLNRGLRSVQNDFKMATTGTDGFGKGIETLKSKTEMLTKSIDIQKEIVEKYESKVKSSGETLEKNTQNHIKLKEQVDSSKKAYQESKKTLGENAEETKKLKEEHEGLKKGLEKSEEKIRNSVKTLENYEDKTAKATIKLKGMEVELANVTNELAKNENKWVLAGKSLEETSTKLDKVGKGVSGAGDKILKLSAPLVAAGIAGVKSAIDFESAFAGVRKTVEGTEEQFQALEKGIKDATKVMPQSATEIAGVAESAGKLGIKTENILSFTKTMVKLGDSTNMSSEQAATSLARLANITGMSQDNFDRLGSTVVALGNNLATNESEIVDMGLRLAGAGKQVGMTEAQILSFAGALSSVGIEAEAGGSAFSKVMINMAVAVEKGGQDLENFANNAGMSAEGFKKAFKEDATGAIVEFIKGLATAEERGQSAIGILTDMDIKEVGLRDSLLRAAGASSVFTKSLEIGTKAWEENIALTKEAEQRYETTESKLKMARNQIVNAGMEIGANLVPHVVALAEKASELAEKFSNLDPETQKLIVNAGLLTVGLGGVLSIGGRVVTGAGAMIGMAGKLAGALGGASVATTGVGTAATVATGAGGTGGLAGLMTGLGGVMAMTGPFGLSVGAIAGIVAGVAGAGYLVKKSLDEDVIPTVDLFANKVEGMTGVIVTEANALEVASQATVTTISEGTKKAVGAYIELDDKARQTMNSLYVNGTVVTGQMVNDIVAQYNQMGQQVNTQLEADKNKELDTLKSFLDKSIGISEEEKNKLIEGTNKFYTDKQNLTIEANARIEEILKTASDQQRELYKSEKEEINKIQDEQRVNAVNILSEQEVEAKVILERIKEYDGRITAEQASEHIKELNKQKDGAIKSANEEYKETIAAIIRKRDESKEITAEQADDLIAEAKRQKEETIKKAEETRDSAVATMVNQNEQLVGSVDLATGEILSKLDKLINKWDGWDPKPKTFINDYVVRTTYEGSPRLIEPPDITPGKTPWVLPKKWTGDSNFKGGLSYVGERGRELLVYPGGGVDITANSTEIRNLPKGTRIFNNQDTEKILSGGAGKKIPGFAKGNTKLESGVQNQFMMPKTINFITIDIDEKASKDRMIKSAKELADKVIKEVETDLSIKPLINVSDATLKKNVTDALKQGEKAQQNYSEFLNKLNADEVDKSIKLLDKEYKANVSNVNKKIEALKSGNAKKNKARLESARKELSTLKENNRDTVSLLKERSSEINELAKEENNIFKDKMAQYDEAIKRLSISTKDLDKDLLNQNTIVVLQEKRIKELTDRYTQLIKKFGATSDESLKMKKSLEEAKTEFSKMGETIKETTEKLKQSQISEVNNLVNRVTNALKKRYDEELKLSEESINKELSKLEEWKNKSIERINSVYDTRINRINEVSTAQIKALEDELKKLEQVEKKESREELDKKDLEKINKLKTAIEYEHNDFNKKELEKELDRAIKEREDRLSKEALEDRKEKIREQMANIKEDADIKKKALEDDKKAELDKIKSVYEEEKIILSERLTKVKEHNQERLKEVNLQAEAEKMIMENNQKAIVELLGSYEESYKLAGNTLGERLFEGMKPKIDEVKQLIDSLEKQVSAIANKSSSVISSSGGSGGGFTGKNNNVGSDDYRKENPDMPSWLGGGKSDSDGNKPTTVNNNITINSPKAISHSEGLRQAVATSRKLAFSF